MPRCVYAEVPGVPVPQGSMRLLRDKQGNPYMTHASSRLSAWRRKVSGYLEGWEPLGGAVKVVCCFELPRPSSVRRRWPTVKPDVDKLARAVLDAIEASGLLQTDAQVTSLIATKTYATGEPRLLLTLEEYE